MSVPITANIKHVHSCDRSRSSRMTHHESTLCRPWHSNQCPTLYLPCNLAQANNNRGCQCRVCASYQIRRPADEASAKLRANRMDTLISSEQVVSYRRWQGLALAAIAAHMSLFVLHTRQAPGSLPLTWSHKCGAHTHCGSGD